MEMDFDITLDDFHHAQRLNSQMSRRTKILLAVILGPPVVVGAFLLWRGSEWAPLFLIPPVLVAVMRTILAIAILPQAAAQAYAQHKAAHVPQHVEITAEGVTSSSAHGHAQLPWSHFIRWRQDPHVFLLYQTDRQFLMIPQRAFGSQENCDQLVKLLATNEIPAA